jgi:hypothetical protein
VRFGSSRQPRWACSAIPPSAWWWRFATPDGKVVLLRLMRYPVRRLTGGARAKPGRESVEDDEQWRQTFA